MYTQMALTDVLVLREVAKHLHLGRYWFSDGLILRFIDDLDGKLEPRVPRYALPYGTRETPDDRKI